MSKTLAWKARFSPRFSRIALGGLGRKGFCGLIQGDHAKRASVPRVPCEQQAGCAFHIINRGNDRVEVFHKGRDYESFLSLLVTAEARYLKLCRRYGFSATTLPFFHR